MERLIEFIGNNLLWVSLWFGVLLLLIWNLFGHILLGIKQLEPMEVTRLINREHAVVIDIRKPAEYESGHLLNAINIPETEYMDKKKEMDKYRNKPLVVYCQNGGVSPQMVRRFKADGFSDVACLRGGVVTWQRAGLPLTRGSRPGG